MRAALALSLAQAEIWPACPEKGCLPCPQNADRRPNCTCLEGYTADGQPTLGGERLELGWDTMRGWLSDCVPVRCGSAELPTAASAVRAEDPPIPSVETSSGSWESDLQGEAVETGGNASTTAPSSALPSSRLLLQRCGARGNFVNLTGVACEPVCGDALLVATDHLPIYDEREQCDDGNRNSGDGCDAWM
eukprot:s1704_g2.t1